MKSLVSFVLGLLLMLACLPDAIAAEESDAPTFEEYQLVFLMTGPDRKERGSEEAVAIQKAHRAHLRKMKESGKMKIAGPFWKQWDESFRGLCIYDVGSLEEARALAEADPAVKGGQLRIEVMNWYVMPGRMTCPPLVEEKPQQKTKRRRRLGR